jgi:DNA-binding response OmpR family regulator
MPGNPAEQDGGKYVDLAGRHVLVVEDEFWSSCGLEDILTDAGCVVLGPAESLAEAMRHARAERIDAALLEVVLGREPVFPVAYALRHRGVPFAFLSGYQERILPPDLVGSPLLRKPYLVGGQVLKLIRKLVRTHD